MIIYFARQSWLTTDFLFFIFSFFLQVVRAFLSGQLEKIWNTSVKQVVIALLTNIFEIREINVNTVDWKNASSWEWDVTQ